MVLISRIPRERCITTKEGFTLKVGVIRRKYLVSGTSLRIGLLAFCGARWLRLTKGCSLRFPFPSTSSDNPSRRPRLRFRLRISTSRTPLLSLSAVDCGFKLKIKNPMRININIYALHRCCVIYPRYLFPMDDGTDCAIKPVNQ